MAGLPADTLAIHRLRVRHANSSNPGVRKEDAERLRKELEWHSRLEAPSENWVFVRRVAVYGPRSRLAQDLVQAVQREATGGQGDNVVRFADLIDLLAALLTDLITGQAAQRWHWQRWAHLFPLPPPQAVTNLLAEHLDHLPSVCAQLAQRRSLTRLWQNLDDSGADRLATESARNSGFSLPPAGRFEAALHEPPAQPESSPLRINSIVRQRWTPVLQNLSPADPRLPLALVLIAQEVAPAMIRNNPIGVMSQLMRMLHPTWRDALATPHPEAGPPKFFGPQSELSGVHATRPSSGRAIPPGSSTPEKDEHPSAEIGYQSAATTTETPSCSAAGPENRRGDDRINSFSITPPPFPDATDNTSERPSANLSESGPTGSRSETAPPSALQFIETKDPAFDSFSTNQGGLFYLLNFLNRTEAHGLLESSWKELPNGWGWLYRLGQELGLDETDPIVAFMAQRLGFDQPDELSRLPSLPARELLLTLAQHWYGGDGLWHPRLLHVNAVIRTSPSHIDMYASLDAVRLSVRLAGLDINPGWLPWLGVVVNFHYD